MAVAVFLAGLFPDRWLELDATWRVEGEAGAYELDLFLPFDPRPEAEKQLLATDGETVWPLPLRRGGLCRVGPLPAGGRHPPLRLLFSRAESGNAGERRALGAQLAAVRRAGQPEKLRFEAAPGRPSAPPPFPGQAQAEAEFDRAHYLAGFETGRAPPDPVAHYLAFGWREGRNPNPRFETGFYLASTPGLAAEGPCPFLHYLEEGRARGLPATRAEAERRAEAARVAEEARRTAWGEPLRALFAAVGMDPQALDEAAFHRLLVPMFSAAAHHRPGDALTPVQALTRYLLFDFPRGVPPGPLFDPDCYRARARAAGLPPPAGDGNALAHWFRHGVPARVVPTPLFDERSYLALNPDLAALEVWSFEHWLMHGLAEGRPFSLVLRPARGTLAALTEDTRSPARRFLDRHAGRSGLGAAVSEMEGFRHSPAFAALLAEANALDPAVGGVTPQHLSMCAPVHDEAYAGFAALRDLVPPGPFGQVVLMPHGKLGGADYVAGALTRALAVAGGRVLVLRTDAADWERPDWFPEDVPTADLSRHLAALPAHDRTRALFHLLRHLGVRELFNVNSRLGFETLLRYGARLAEEVRLHAYYFCSERTPEGQEFGHPVSHFAPLLPVLAAAITDSRALAEALAARFCLSGALRAKLCTVYSPALSTPGEVPVARDGVAPLFLWAGRLDRQKRVDLLVEVARAMPEARFEAWGKPVLDAAPDLAALPPNLTLHPPFARYEELPLDRAAGWLFTSAWEGLPTLLIELAARGVPVAASAVGGVPELIDETTGWPLPPDAPAAAYVSALRAMLADPAARLSRAAALQARARERHGFDRYVAAIAALREAPGHG